MRRNTWATGELLDILKAVAMLGGDRLTLGAIALALGIDAAEGVRYGDFARICGLGPSGTGKPDAGRGQ